MSVSINTTFHPFRMVLAKREPVQLGIELINRGDEAKKLTLDLSLTRQLALDKAGLKNVALERIERLEPNERKHYYFEVFPKQMTHEGEQAVRINVLEHYNDFKYVQREYKKNIPLTVVER